VTAVVGIFCKDGVVIGTDSSTTFGQSGQFRTIEQPTEKLKIIDNRIIVAGTGQVGVGQRFCAIVGEAWSKHVFKKSPLEVVKDLSRSGLEDINYTHLRPGQYAALLAFPCKKKHYLCEFDLPNFQPELKTSQLWYCSMGSTQPITDPFLGLMRGIFWQDGPPGIHDGIFAVVWALEHAVEVNPGGVNGPIRIAILEQINGGDLKARLLSEEELAQHRQNVEGAREHLREYRNKHRPEAATAEVPKP